VNIDLNTAINLALDQASQVTDQDRESLMITGNFFPDQQPRVHLDGWALFIIIDNSSDDDTLHVGVHMDTGETKIVTGDEDDT
jgi:hypothetical protein